MKNLYQITKIRLINIHNFIDETLPVKNNLFLMGQNRSGKTTILDAIHLALSAGVDMEYNAAARFGPRNDPGRNLASIILRYDLENDRMMREACVGYVIIELSEKNGTHHCFGIGVFATTLDSQPEVWGFIARNKSLEKFEIITSETAQANILRQRPKDRMELEEYLGRGNVLDKGRYRSALGQFLFNDRDGYERALDIISVAKSYREMVSRSRNLDELFINLLPPPATAEFHEVQTALRAIDGIQVNLNDLVRELDVLQFIVQKISEARRETEKISRYEYIRVEFDRQRCQKQKEMAEEQLRKANDVVSLAKKNVDENEKVKNEVQNSLNTLRASEGITLISRADESQKELMTAKERHERFKIKHKDAKENLDNNLLQYEAASKKYLNIRNQILLHLHEINLHGIELLEGNTIKSLEYLTQAIESIDIEAPRNEKEIIKISREIKAAFAFIRNESLSESTHKKDLAERLRIDSGNIISHAEEIERRAEVLPNINKYELLLKKLETKVPKALPLYRLLELNDSNQINLGSIIETWMGPRILGAIVAPKEDEEYARDIVFEQGEGIEILRSTDFTDSSIPAKEKTLPSLIKMVDTSELSRIGGLFINRVFNDVKILSPADNQSNQSQVIWTDGRIFDRGAEAWIQPSPPIFIGAEARREAANRESERLKAEAQSKTRDAELADSDAKQADMIVETASRYLDSLSEPSPEVLFASIFTAESLKTAIAKARTELTSREIDLQDVIAQISHWQLQCNEILELIKEKGLENLQERIQTVEQRLTVAQEEYTKSRTIHARLETEAKQATQSLTNAQIELEDVVQRVSQRHDLLLPLIEPKHRGDLNEYVFKVMRGNQILEQNIEALIQESFNTQNRAFAQINSSDGLKNAYIWQRYAFRLSEETQEIRDQNDHPIEEVFEDREHQVRELQKALDEKTRDLLERVVMAGLVRKLQGQVRELQETIRGVNRLSSDLKFGDSQFQFLLREKAEYQHLLGLLQDEAILQPTTREQLKDFLKARLDEFRRNSQVGVPQVLDYRQWFEFVLQVKSQAAVQHSELSRQRLRFGSTGEQAVPTHLLIIAMASLLYDRIDAHIRLLLMDEAFLGIDAVRREALLQFCDRVGIGLFVATPELDGVTPSLTASTTLLIEKTSKQDVFISDYQWERQPQQSSLDTENQKQPESYIIGTKINRPKS